LAYRSLRDFIAKLEADGELVRVTEPVSTVLEMTEICTRLLATGGPAVLFEKPVMEDGAISPMPCLANLFGTVKRVALGVTLGGEPRATAGDLREVGELLAFLRQPEPPKDLKDAMDMLPLARTVMSMRPKTVKTAPVQQVVLKGDQIDLGKLPVQTCWPGEPAPLITCAGGHQGPVGQPRGRLQPGHLPHAGVGQGPGDHALAGPPRRGPALRPSQEGRPPRSAARLRR